MEGIGGGGDGQELRNGVGKVIWRLGIDRGEESPEEATRLE